MDFDKIVKRVSRTISFCLLCLFFGFFYLETKGHIYSDGFDIIGRSGMRAGGIIKEKSLYVPKKEPLEERSWSKEVLEMTQDRVLGDKEANITIYVFSSFDCPACSNFHNRTLPLIKEYYVDTNKAAFVFKDFPLRKTGLTASILSKCLPEKEYYTFVDRLMKNQGHYLYSKDSVEILKSYSREFGLTDQMVKDCLDNEDLLARIKYLRAESLNKYEIKSTPTIVIETKSGEYTKLVGSQSFEKLQEAIEHF